MESALGSTGINATADCTLTMTRKRGTGEAVLKATGRDIEDTSFTLSWDADICSWSVTGQGALKPALSEAQQQIIDLLKSEARDWSAGEIIEAVGKSKQAVNDLLSKMKGTGLIENPCRGQWRSKAVKPSYREPLQLYSENHPKTPEIKTNISAPNLPESLAVPVEEPAIW
jgi:predicted transcriptional regulator